MNTKDESQEIINQYSEVLIKLNAIADEVHKLTGYTTSLSLIKEEIEELNLTLKYLVEKKSEE